MKKRLREIECFIFDMDGTIYLEDNLIEGAKELLQYLEDNHISYAFLTNNSSKSKKVYKEKLDRLGLEFISKDKIITSGDIMIDYLKKKFKNPKVYLVGTNDLMNEFCLNGIQVVDTVNEEIDTVVVGFDITFNYEKASIATRYIRKGIPFLATNIDLVCPISNREFIPDCGAICSLIEKATGVQPNFIGKPCKETVDYLIDKIKIERKKIAVIGDRLYTDVATGVNNGMVGIAVLTGETTLEEIELSDIKPTYIFESIKELAEEILVDK